MKLMGQGSLIAQQEAKAWLESAKLESNGFGDVWVKVDHPDLGFLIAFSRTDGHISDMHAFKNHQDLHRMDRFNAFSCIVALAMAFALGLVVGLR